MSSKTITKNNDGLLVLLTASEKIWERLQIIQNKAIRAALGLPSYTSIEYIHKISNILKIKQYTLKLLDQTIAKAHSNNNKTLETQLKDIQHEL